MTLLVAVFPSPGVKALLSCDLTVVAPPPGNLTNEALQAEEANNQVGGGQHVDRASGQVKIVAFLDQIAAQDEQRDQDGQDDAGHRAIEGDGMLDRNIVEPVKDLAEEISRTGLDQRVAVLVTFLVGVGLVALVLDMERSARRLEIRPVINNNSGFFLHSFLLCPIGLHAVCKNE